MLTPLKVSQLYSQIRLQRLGKCCQHFFFRHKFSQHRPCFSQLVPSLGKGGRLCQALTSNIKLAIIPNMDRFCRKYYTCSMLIIISIYSFASFFVTLDITCVCENFPTIGKCCTSQFKSWEWKIFQRNWHFLVFSEMENYYLPIYVTALFCVSILYRLLFI